MPSTLSTSPSPQSSMPARNPTPPPQNEESKGGQEENNKAKDTPKKGNHKIKNFEWGLLIALAIIVDIIQFVLTFFVVGVVINRFITIIGGIVVPVYFYLRGITMNSKKWTNIVASFVLELIPIVDMLPAWTRLIFRIMAIDKAEEKLEQAEQRIPGGQLAGAMVDKKLGARGAPPPVIGSSGLPTAEPGAVPPKIGSSERKGAEPDMAPAVMEFEQPRGNQRFHKEGEQSSSDSDTKTSNTVDLREKSNTTPTNNVVDLRNNPHHERIEGRDEGFKEAA